MFSKSLGHVLSAIQPWCSVPHNSCPDHPDFSSPPQSAWSPRGPDSSSSCPACKTWAEPQSCSVLPTAVIPAVEYSHGQPHPLRPHLSCRDPVTFGQTADSRVVHQPQSPGAQAGVGLEDNAVLVTEISDSLGSQQWMGLILEDCGSGQAFLVTELQQLHQLSVAEVTNSQTADLLAHKLAHLSVGLQSSLGRPVQRNLLQMMNEISSLEWSPPPVPPYLCWQEALSWVCPYPTWYERLWSPLRYYKGP